VNITSFFRNNGKYISGISISKTLWFNIRYFGLKRGLLCPVWIHRNVRINNAKGKIEIKKFQAGIVKIGWKMMENFSRKTVWNVNGGVVQFNGYAGLGAGTQIINHGVLTFGDGFAITGNTDVICYKQIEFGDETLVSWDCLIMDHDYHKLTDYKGNRNIDLPIKIGNHVWIGTRNLILHGVVIGDDCVLAANSTVTCKHSQDNLLIVGNRVLKENITWEI
jgi:acetyltransferase-like isoleucine patch superfamily enzyme